MHHKDKKPKRQNRMTEQDRNRIAWEAHERFLRSGIQIDDVYENLGKASGSPIAGAPNSKKRKADREK